MTAGRKILASFNDRIDGYSQVWFRNLKIPSLPFRRLFSWKHVSEFSTCTLHICKAFSIIIIVIMTFWFYFPFGVLRDGQVLISTLILVE